MTESINAQGAAAVRWERPPVEHYQIGAAVHVWRVNLRQSSLPVREAAELLSDQEHIRGRRFRQPADRDRYMLAHGTLRTILGRYLNESPAQIRFQETTQGKPSLTAEFESSRLRFNLAHSGDWALVAVAAGREVGVDVEQFRPLLEAAPIAKRYFAPAELAHLEALNEAERPAVFFDIWASKEAFIKATGAGLSAPLQSFSVPLLAAARPALIQTGAGQAWGLLRLAPGAGYAGAVVTEGLDWEVALWQF